MNGIRVDTDRQAGPDLRINCPLCSERDVAATSYTDVSKNYVLWTLLLYTSQLRIVQCSGCGGRLEADRELGDLAEMQPDELEPHLGPYVQFVWKVMAWIAIGTCWMPIFGQVFSLVVYLGTRNSTGRTSRLALWAVRISWWFMGVVLVVGVAMTLAQWLAGG